MSRKIFGYSVAVVAFLVASVVTAAGCFGFLDMLGLIEGRAGGMTLSTQLVFIAGLALLFPLRRIVQLSEAFANGITVGYGFGRVRDFTDDNKI